MKFLKKSLTSKFFLLHLVRFAVCVIFTLGTSQLHAAGGYLSFSPLGKTPGTFSKVDFYFDVVRNPGPSSEVYYAHNFSFKTTTGKILSGYIGLQSTDIIGTGAYALVSLWPGHGEVVSMVPGPDAKCWEANDTAEGHVASCDITKENPLANGIQNGDRFRIYIDSVQGRKNTYEFGIENLTQKKNNVLGQITFTDVIGINPSGLSHFLEYFGSNASHCGLIPYTAYIEKGPIGYSGVETVKYQVVPNPDGPFGPCQNNITFIDNYASAKVEFAIPKHPFTPNDLGCNNGDDCLLNSIMDTQYEFSTFDGNWSFNLKLPQHSLRNAELSVSSHAGYTSALFSEGSGIVLVFPFGTMRLATSIMFHTNDKYTFVNRGSTDTSAWEPGGSSFKSLSPNQSGPYIPGAPRLVVYKMSDGDWNSTIYLPDNPTADQLVIIHSDASWSSQLHSSSTGPVVATLATGKTVVYQYGSKGWKRIDWQSVEAL
ncbi:hypothetical protein [Photorhabdus stackebrandtii]|uniref:Metalloprotease StcE beta-sandwich domain-containing protein n=1 Tax=Photorhabdus stackebrandtii TaxID=1123042 RepID=A0A7X5QQK6_9GAMM|nr:hypothetical protein [Photorhabdus stackebrandtii]NHB98738.1 hypothetical protein [Photorhabdus stackebrandtii]